MRKSDNRRSPSSGGIGGEDPTPGANAVIGNPAVVSPSTLFLFKAPEASLPLSRRVLRELHLDIRIRRGRFTVLRPQEVIIEVVYDLHPLDSLNYL